MANRWKGNLIASAATSSGTNYTGKANGAWCLNSQLQQKAAGLWAINVTPPLAPSIYSATPGNAKVTLDFTPGLTGGGTVTYTATSSPGGITASASGSPILVQGLTNGTPYSFTVRGDSEYGVGALSANSNTVTPIAQLLAFAGLVTPKLSVWSLNSTGWDTQYPAYISTHAENPLTVSFTSNGKYIVYVTNNAQKNVYIIEAANGNQINSYAANSTNTVLNAFEIAPNMAVAVGAYGTGDITSYGFANNEGVTTKHATEVYTNSNFNPEGLAIHPYSNAVVVGRWHATTGISAYNLSTSGIGSKMSDPSTQTPHISGVTFNPSGNAVVGGKWNSPFVAAYNWSGGFGTKFADPATLPPENFWRRPAFTEAGNVVALTGMAVYSWSTSGFGTKFANPATAFTDFTVDVAFNRAATIIGVSIGSNPGVLLYSWSSSGFGTKLANSSPAYTGQVNGLAMY